MDSQTNSIGEIIMGAGNYWLTNAETVYVDCDDVYGNDDEYYFDDVSFRDFIESITSLIPIKSFSSTEKHIYDFQETRLVIAENGWYHITVVEWHTYFAINIELKPAHESDPWEFNPLAIYQHAATAKKIFDEISHYFQLRVRTSAWTSGLYQRA
jgi:hypothetical protein